MKKFLTKGAALLGALAAAPIMAAGVAQAGPYDPPVQNPADYLDGDTAYFSYNQNNCSISKNGDVGCDMPQGYSYTGFFVPINVNNVAIDLPFLPAHPTFGLTGPLGKAGSKPLAGSLTYAGAHCQRGLKQELTCESKGHSFFLWTPYLQTT